MFHVFFNLTRDDWLRWWTYCWDGFKPPVDTVYIYIYIWLVVWNMCYFSIYWEQYPNLTNIFQRGWNHQPDIYWPVYIYIYGNRSNIILFAKNGRLRIEEIVSTTIYIYIYVYLFIYYCIYSYVFLQSCSRPEKTSSTCWEVGAVMTLKTRDQKRRQRRSCCAQQPMLCVSLLFSPCECWVET